MYKADNPFQTLSLGIIESMNKMSPGLQPHHQEALGIPANSLTIFLQESQETSALGPYADTSQHFMLRLSMCLLTCINRFFHREWFQNLLFLFLHQRLTLPGCNTLQSLCQLVYL